MTALWIILGVAVVALLAWRLRLAARKVDRILGEERAASEREGTSDVAGDRAEHRNR